jgi:hypothetical protein
MSLGSAKMVGVGRSAINTGRPLHSGPKEATMQDQITLPTLPVQGEVEFRHIADFPGYAIGNDGSVWTCRRVGPPYGISSSWRRSCPTRNNSGHYVIVLRQHGKPRTMMLHRLLLTAFVGPCPEGMEACHNNGDPADNCLVNLRWDTRLANVADSRRHGTIARGSRNGHAKATESDVIEIRQRVQAGEKQKDLAVEYGMGKSRISQIVNRRTWRHV